MSSSSIESHSKPATFHVEGKAEQQAHHKHHFISRIHTHGDSNELVTIGGKTYHRHELMSAFGGSLDPGARPFPKTNINSTPLGLCAFGLSCFVLGLFNARAMGITIPNAAASLSCFYGALGQMIAGLMEFPTGNTFAFTALTSYGGFWLGYACVFIPSFGIMAAYEGTDQFDNAFGLFLLGWVIWTTIIVVMTLKSTLAFFLMFFFLDLTFILLACAELTGKVGVARAGGVIGVITAFLAWYNGLSGIATPLNSYTVPPDLPLPVLEFERKSK